MMNLLVAIGLVSGFGLAGTETHPEIGIASANKHVSVRNTLGERVEARLEGSSFWTSIPARGLWQTRIRTSASSIVVYARVGRDSASARVPFVGDIASCAVVRHSGRLAVVYSGR